MTLRIRFIFIIMFVLISFVSKREILLSFSLFVEKFYRNLFNKLASNRFAI